MGDWLERHRLITAFVVVPVVGLAVFAAKSLITPHVDPLYVFVPLFAFAVLLPILAMRIKEY